MDTIDEELYVFDGARLRATVEGLLVDKYGF